MKVAMDPGSPAYFNKVAEEYASWYYAQSPGGYALRVRQQRVLELLDRPSGKVLDVGCGPGVLARELLDRGCEFWGVDASPRMIEECRKHLGKNDRAHFGPADATSLEFPDEYFDAVICMGVIDRIPAYDAALKEMARVVKKNGTLLISFPNLLSPYATWKKFPFYPTVALLRPVYYGLAGRPQPPSMPSSLIKLYTARTAAKLLARHGVEITDVVYYYFNVFLSPLDELLPRWTARVIHRLEPLRFGRLKWLGAGFILKAKKRL